MRLRPAILVVVACLSACAGVSRSPAPKLHSLAAASVIAMTPVPEASENGMRILIAAISVPESVDRPQFMIRHGEGELESVDAERWAEPLKRAIPRVLAADLMQQIEGASVWSSPSAAPTQPDARVGVEIARFDSYLGAESVIEALWVVRGGGDERSGRTLARTAVNGNDYAALVEAHRAGLAAVSRDIARALRAPQTAR